MTDKPSQWALEVADRARNPDTEHGLHTFRYASAMVIEQARAQWEREICDWLRGEHRAIRDFRANVRNLDEVAASIERGEHREGK